MRARPTSASDATLAALFFLSGACGLVYQVIWVHMLLPVFGTGVQDRKSVV